MFPDKPVIRNSLFIAITTFCSVTAPAAFATDIVRENEQAPAPPIEQRGIWGAISYSPIKNKYGFFWGADKRNEAEDISLRYCEHNADVGCRLVITFRNHRHWSDDDKSSFPYEHCAALSVSTDKDGKVTHWGVASAATRKKAEDAASINCGDADLCKVREWACT